jgi:two-component system OmpR family response regulator
MSSQIHILIVDDDPEIRSLLARYLSGQGFRTSVASNRAECENQLSASGPDLVGLDVMLLTSRSIRNCVA